jgi:hypothetical protein
MSAYVNVCSFHWILLIIQINDGKVDIIDPLDKDTELYKNLHDMLQR